ncbi:type II toxin-antitoxin system Phd/YefM family antitoxin [Rhodococcus sp. NPDC060090]|uniref:type II toxin-antitoxin system Phd/YefM family antitoxin n=1 Tax=Rhodococcus sp. NPDC060090 TaxID=3347056 RepID=UPI0036678F0A
MRVPSTTVKSARRQLKDLIRQVNDDTVAVEITGKRDTAVLISKARYVALQEASFLLRSPELMDSLRREMERALQEQMPESAAEADDPVEHPTAKRARRSRPRNRKKKRKRR